MTSTSAEQAVKPLTDEDFSTGNSVNSFRLGNVADAADIVERIRKGEDLRLTITMLLAAKEQNEATIAHLRSLIPQAGKDDVEMARAHLAEIDAADVVAICPPVKCEVCQGTGVVDGPDYCDACGAAGEYLDEQALIEWRVQKLAALISAARGAERERCARIADEEYQRQASPIHRSAQRAANAIRALPKEPTP